jgi:hypothetical protein
MVELAVTTYVVGVRVAGLKVTLGPLPLMPAGVLLQEAVPLPRLASAGMPTVAVVAFQTTLVSAGTTPTLMTRTTHVSEQLVSAPARAVTR